MNCGLKCSLAILHYYKIRNIKFLNINGIINNIFVLDLAMFFFINNISPLIIYELSIKMFFVNIIMSIIQLNKSFFISSKYKNYLNIRNYIKKKIISTKYVDEIILRNKPIIALLRNKNNLYNNHYIIISGIVNNSYLIAYPTVNTLKQYVINKQILINLIKKSGGWLLITSQNENK